MPTYGGSLLEVGEEEILQMKDYTGVFMHKLTPTLLNIKTPSSSDRGRIHQVRCVGRKLKASR